MAKRIVMLRTALCKGLWMSLHRLRFRFPGAENPQAFIVLSTCEAVKVACLKFVLSLKYKMTGVSDMSDTSRRLRSKLNDQPYV